MSEEEVEETRKRKEGNVNDQEKNERKKRKEKGRIERIGKNRK